MTKLTQSTAGRLGKRFVRCAGAAAALLIALLPAVEPAAQTLCNKPLQPLCSTDMQDFTDESERQRCVGDVNTFLEDLGNYRACLEGSMKSAEEALQSAERFRSCLEEGRDDCRLEADSKL